MGIFIVAHTGPLLRVGPQCNVTDWPFNIVLASASPRRAELLSQIAAKFTIDAADLDEEALIQKDPFASAENLALAKAVAVFRRHPNSVVIGGDTIVAVPSGNSFTQLGKPDSPNGAAHMLRLLSGVTHLVITGVALATPHGREAFCEKTEVTFRVLTDTEIHEYVASGEPMDKAGAYAIQGGAAKFVESLSGSHSNVVGLPIEELEIRLERYRQMCEL